MLSESSYIGRFAPSPTGPLHFGSLVAAAGSYLHARAAGGQWLLRIEDVDTERNVPGAEAEILRALDAYGFVWDGPLLRQTSRRDAYAEVLDSLRCSGAAYACACSRSEIARAAGAAGFAPAVDGGVVYPGICRNGVPAGREARAWRLRVPEPGQDAIGFDDALQGRIVQQLAREVGDFVLKRADGPFAYQLAVVVDDAFQGITDVVRGADLIDSTPRQIWLQRCLGYPTPTYLHLPLVVDAAGQKLSKQTRAPALDAAAAGATLWQAFAFLGIRLPAATRAAGLAELWSLALATYRASGFASANRGESSA